MYKKKSFTFLTSRIVWIEFVLLKCCFVFKGGTGNAVYYHSVKICWHILLYVLFYIIHLKGDNFYLESD